MATNSVIYVVTRAGDVLGVYDNEAEARRVADIAKADGIWWCRMNWGCTPWYQP
jgi:hypothetical protein